MIENIIFTIVYLISIIAFDYNKQISLAIFTTNSLGLILPDQGLNAFVPFGFLLGALICLFGCKDTKGNEINHSIAYLFGLRVLIDLPKIAGNTGIEITWIISTLFLMIQLLLVCGVISGNTKRIDNYLSECRININNFITR